MWRWYAHSTDLGKVAFKSDIYKLDQTSILYGETNDQLEFMSKGTSSISSFIFVLKGRLDIIDIKNRRVQSAIEDTATSAVDHPDMKIKPQAGSAWITYRVPVTILREYFECMLHRPFDTLSFAPLYNFRKGGASALYSALCHVMEDMSGVTKACRPLYTNIYDQLLLAKLISIKPDYAHGTDKTTRHRVKPRYLLRAELFMRENVHKEITIDDIANQAGCSARALQRMFKEYSHKSPMGVLCDYRLSAAHQAIISGSTCTASNLAAQFRFANASRFSSLYRTAYGMSPYAMMRFHATSGCKRDHA
jgi:AraC-like DNA-binding protein